MREKALIAALAAGGFAACTGGSSPLVPCGDNSEPPICVAQLHGPCGEWSEVGAVCGDKTWRCSDGAKEYVASTTFPLSCELESSIGASMTLGGECIWPFDQGGRKKIGRAFSQPTFGSCPQMEPEALDLLDTSDLAEDRWVDVMDTIDVTGKTISLYRLFALDETAVFGLRGLSGDVAAHDEFGRIKPSEARLFDDDFYRSAAVEDRHLYVLECGGESRFLSYGCNLRRVPIGRENNRASYELVAEDIFEAGPHFELRRHEGLGRWVLLTIGGFGDRVEARTAERIEGPWSEPRTIALCDLPADDPNAFCDGARQHPSLRDPFEPDQIVLSYRVATLSPDKGPYPTKLIFTRF